MRLIKFRAWDKTSKILVEVLEIDWLENRLVMQTLGKSTERWTNFLDNVELMQFTGLLDKSGKEIYEGDIIKMPHFYYGHAKKQPNGVRLKVVTWRETAAATGFDISKNNHSAEVIGNIYENPELLNK